jgi:DNA-binding response OmpR family regulator
MTWRVLVADDDPEICTLIKTILKSASFDVMVCADAESALVHLQRDQPYDILISDFMLPGISGIELITMVRANPQTAKLPILMISGHSNYAMDARAKSAGADHFLNKPFTLSQLRSTVTALASKYRPIAGADAAPAVTVSAKADQLKVSAADPLRVTSSAALGAKTAEAEENSSGKSAP